MKRPATALILLLFCLSAVADGPFQQALPGYLFEFPRDHGAHDEYATEWWYFTGHLTADDGHHYGFELTFFRVGVAAGATSGSPWELRNVALAHFAVTDIDRRLFRYHEKLNRMSPYTADAANGRLDVFNEGWRARTLPDGSYGLKAGSGGDAIDLHLSPRKPPAIHGENGVSVKAEGAGYASHYYSLTRLEVHGSITAGGRSSHCGGVAWMDHEFGSSALRESQQGWDWFSVQLDDDTELMLYQIRRRDGSADVTSSGSLVTSDGTVVHLKQKDFSVTPLAYWRSPRSGANYPMGWKVVVIPLKLSITVRSPVRDQELVTAASTRVTYWEGAVDASGSFGGTPVTGVGYVEMTGYAQRFGEH